MSVLPGRRKFSFLPAYNQNAAFKLVAVLGACFIIFKIIWLFWIATYNFSGYDATMQLKPFVALPPLRQFAGHWWTIFTYGLLHEGFWMWLSNMVWLYCFGNIVQNLVGHRQVIPIFVYGYLAGAIFCLLGQLIPSVYFQPLFPHNLIMTAEGGIVALAVASLTISPRYRFYLADNLGIPLWVLVLIFLALSMGVFTLPYLMLAVGGGLTGFLYIRFLKMGYHPGGWAYRLVGAAESWAHPDEKRIQMKRSIRRNEVKRRDGFSQTRIDDILDKINQKGYDSLSKEEKDLLLRAGTGDNEKH